MFRVKQFVARNATNKGNSARTIQQKPIRQTVFRTSSPTDFDVQRVHRDDSANLTEAVRHLPVNDKNIATSLLSLEGGIKYGMDQR
ncbi:MAG: hypothetical protein A2W80_14440 [Candidatus Riflebacteria bacterium GWC2_50_8]|nr:MAG: hypothetical protein A2W80_14440 [Candidatus Riflebacteria bacterium GWC2_50_8]